MKPTFNFIQPIIDRVLSLHVKVTKIHPDDTPGQEIGTTATIIILSVIAVLVAAGVVYMIIDANMAEIPEMVHK